MLAAEIDVGRRIAGKYELVRLLGKGAMGEVWLATHDTLGGEFAIKLVRPSEEPEDETAAGRFQLEAQVSAKLSRKTRHIVSVSDHGEEDGLAYLVMELLDGESLEARIKRGPMDLATTVAVVLQIGRALSQAHQEGIFHRDLKPANVFLTRDEDGRLLVKLLDFGIARSNKPFSTRSPFATGKDMVLGTPSYMSPEQARGLDSLDYRCDLWALSVVAYEALTGRIPWEGDSVEDIFLSICLHRMVPLVSLRPDLGPEVEAIFARSFAPKLDERYRTADEVAAAFEQLVDPMDLDAALGVRAAPSSSRRLAGAARASQQDIAVAPGGPIRRSNPSYPQMGSEPAAFTVPDGGTLRIKKNNGGIVAIIAVLMLLLFGGVGFFALTRKPAPTTATEPPPPTTATTIATANVPPPISADPTPAPPTSAVTAKTTAKPTSTPPSKTAHVPPPVASPPTQQPAVAQPTPTPPPSTTPAPPPSAKAPHNRSDVF